MFRAYLHSQPQKMFMFALIRKSGKRAGWHIGGHLPRDELATHVIISIHFLFSVVFGTRFAAPGKRKSVPICIKCGITFPLWVGRESPRPLKGWIWDDFVGRKPVKPLVCPAPSETEAWTPFPVWRRVIFVSPTRRRLGKTLVKSRDGKKERKQQITSWCITWRFHPRKICIQGTLVDSYTQMHFYCRNGTVWLSSLLRLFENFQKLCLIASFSGVPLANFQGSSPAYVCVWGLFAFNLLVILFCWERIWVLILHSPYVRTHS